MKQPLRYFSIGLLTATVILVIVFLLINNTGDNKNKMTTDEMIDALKEDGYRVLTDSDYMTLALSGEQTEEEEDADADAEAEDKEEADDESSEESSDEKEESDEDDAEDADEESDKITYTINIKENMYVPEVTKLLEEKKIISDADKFTKYLEDEGFAEYIQLGKHDVDNKMSERELAKAITNK